MATFAQMKRGRRAVDRVELALNDGGPDDMLVTLVRVMAPGEEIEVVHKAGEYAKAKGAAACEPGDEVFDLAIWAHTLLVVCLDPESPEDARRPFFGSVDEILSDDPNGLTSEHVAYLYERWRAWQDACSPRVSDMTETQAMELCRKIGAAESLGEVDRFLADLRPYMRAAFARFTANRLLVLLRANSSPIGTSPETQATTN